ncbi:MAG: carboxylating nicotinate-nucleotide diphosphorylase [Stappiaceae bacterium]
MGEHLPTLPRLFVEDAVGAALREDWGRAGDLTGQATIPVDAQAEAKIVTRQAGCLSGLALVASACRQTDPQLQLVPLISDGEQIVPEQTVAEIMGPARALLACERVGLNFLGHLSGIATATSAFVQAVSHTDVKIVCTRKTTPGLRAFEKYAVRCGGGANHRFGLDDAVLIKDNHIAVAGGVTIAIARAKAFAGHLVKVEVEVDTLEQLKQAIAAGPDVIMLDNMAPDTLRTAVDMASGSGILLEASGGVTLDSVGAIAETGVDLISTGWITHSAPTLDLGLDIQISAEQ